MSCGRHKLGCEADAVVEVDEMAVAPVAIVPREVADGGIAAGATDAEDLDRSSSNGHVVAAEAVVEAARGIKGEVAIDGEGGTADKVATK